MASIRASAEIRAPVSDVFAFVSRVENIPKWQSEVVTSKAITPGPTRLGTQYEEVVKLFGKKVATLCEVTEFQPTRRITFRSTSSRVVSYVGTFSLEPDGRGTKLSVNAQFTFNGLWKLIDPLFRMEMRKGIHEELNKLKSLLEPASKNQI